MRADFSRLRERAAVIQAVRSFFCERGFLEVATPVRLPAILPEAAIGPVSSGAWFLQSSPEQCMKRLLAAGSGPIFQICPCFRAGERGRRHLPEFSLLEWYEPERDYHALMSRCEELFAVLRPGGRLRYGGCDLDLTPPWPRLSLADAFARYGSMSLERAVAGDRFEEVLCLDVEPRLGRERPVFVVDYPAAMASLAALDSRRPQVAQRVELYLAGLELANGFTELADPHEQRRRFEAEQAAIRAAGRDPGPMPERFLADLARMPPAAGMALGLDRLLMLLTGAESIDEVVAFTPEEL